LFEEATRKDAAKPSHKAGLMGIKL
jgi:hypothetical protein